MKSESVSTESESPLSQVAQASSVAASTTSETGAKRCRSYWFKPCIASKYGTAESVPTRYVTADAKPERVTAGEH